MANNFTTIQNNQASEKFLLVRLTPKYYIVDDLADQGGGVYEATFSLPIAKVQRNGTDLTEVTTVSSNDEWSHDEDTNTFQVQLASAPSSTNVIIVFFYLFYTESIFRVVNEDPEDTTTTLRDWQAKIESSPSVAQTVEEVENGFLSISSTSMSIINESGDFYSYLGDNYSFYNAICDIWVCLDSTDNIQKLFKGIVSKLSINDRRITFTIEDQISKLKSEALFGDDSSETVHSIIDNSALDPNADGQPIRMFFGFATRYALQNDPDNTPSLSGALRVVPQYCEQAFNVNYSNTVSTSTNREWNLGRVTSDGLLDFSHTPTTVDNAAGGYTVFSSPSADVAKFLAGDTMVWNDGGVDRYTRVILVDNDNDDVYITKEANLTTGDDIKANNAPTIVILDTTDNSQIYPLYGRDYTATVSNTNGGNKNVKITFVNNFETNHSGITTLDPSIHEVYFRLRPDTTNAKHGSVAKTIMEKVGLTVNAASVTTANTTLATNCSFSIPFRDESTYASYLEYLQMILKSALAYVTLNNSFEYEYKLLATPSSTDDITDTEILKDTFDIEIDYADIKNEINAFNRHLISSEQAVDSSNTPWAVASSVKSKHLHEVERLLELEHVLEKFNDKVTDHINLLSNRKATYVFETKTVNLDNIIGDDLRLSRTGLLGDVSTESVKIVGISKKSNVVKLITKDLLNI